MTNRQIDSEPAMAMAKGIALLRLRALLALPSSVPKASKTRKAPKQVAHHGGVRISLDIYHCT
jgi:hypothetical protein